METYCQCKRHDRRITHLEDFGLVYTIVRNHVTFLDGETQKRLIYDSRQLFQDRRRESRS
ncbi:hypothetical protein P3S68_032708 [Capsicum galapagoense]